MKHSNGFQPIQRRSWTIALIFTLLLAAFSSAAAAKNKDEYLMYVGTYTQDGSKSKGIYSYRYDSHTKELTSLGLAAATINPSFLTVHPNGRFLYAVNEVGNYDGQKSGAVSAFSIDHATGKLTLLNEVASGGADPCYLVVDRTGKFVLIANYTGGSIAVFPILNDGKLGERSAFIQHTGHGFDPKRQEAPHAHSIDMSPDDRFAIVDDLGLDETLVYKFDSSKGSLTPNDPPFAKAHPGDGPRHFALSSNGRFGYVLNEMTSSVSVFSFDASTGALQFLQTLPTIPKTFTTKNTDAEIRIAPSGKFLYASARGHDSIAVFAIDPNQGNLSFIEYASTKGQSPRNFEIDPSGSLLFAANEKSDDIVVFRIDPKTGRLAPTGKVLDDISQPVCIKFVAAN